MNLIPRFLSLVLLLFLSATMTSSLSLATTATTTPSMPVVQFNDFFPGQSWVWVYYTEGDFSRPYSYEKYTVDSLDSEKGKITFILSSRFSVDESFQNRHKFIVELKKCHKAYDNPNMKVNWLIETFYFSPNNNSWVSMGRNNNTLVFEEKFNCNPHKRVNHSRFETNYREFNDPTLGNIRTFSQRTKNTPYGYTWYFATSAVGYLKEFNPNSTHFYVMRLEEQ